LIHFCWEPKPKKKKKKPKFFKKERLHIYWFLVDNYQSFNKGPNFIVISLNEGLCEASPFQQCFIRSTNNLAAGSSCDISGIGG